jgi:hypothetical protein
MSFHSEHCAKYIESGQCLCNKTLKSVAEYFKNICNSQVADGSFTKKRKHQVEYHAKRKLCSCSRSGTRKNYIVLQNSVAQATAAVADVIRHIIIKTTSGRVETTEIITPTMTNARRHTRTRFLLILVKRYSSPAPCMDQRVITPFKSATRTPKNKTSDKLTTKNASTSRTTTMQATQVTMMRRVLVWICRSQVRTIHQSRVKAISMRMRIIIFISTKK